MNYLKSRQYNSIDLLKFIMAFLVIYIHRPMLTDASPMANMIINQVFTRLAVPFFFAVAGFLFFGKAEIGQKTPSEDYLFVYIKRLVKMYIIWGAIYLPAKLYTYYTQHLSVTEILVDFSKEVFLYGAYLHLWFLPALAISIVLAFLLLKKVSVGVATAISICLNIFYYAVLISTDNQSITRNYWLLAVFFGFAFVSIGAFVAQHKCLSRKYNLWGFGIFIFAAVVIEIIRYKSNPHLLDIRGLLMTPTIFFLLSIAKDTQLKARKCYSYLRRTSMLIYLTHLLLPETMVYTIMYLIGHEQLGYSYLFRFFLVLGYTLPLSFGLVWLEEKKHFGWIKKLH